MNELELKRLNELNDVINDPRKKSATQYIVSKQRLLELFMRVDRMLQLTYHV